MYVIESLRIWWHVVCITLAIHQRHTSSCGGGGGRNEGNWRLKHSEKRTNQTGSYPHCKSNNQIELLYAIYFDKSQEKIIIEPAQDTFPLCLGVMFRHRGYTWNFQKRKHHFPTCCLPHARAETRSRGEE
uniref:Putative secreted protein n=1 Tax=Ixodes ricinus TaxID=34613 RepID=A0A6B0UR17_IXORI